MPDSAEVCGCNGVCKGSIVKAIKEKGLFHRWTTCAKHTKASSPAVPAPAWSSRSSPRRVGGAYQPAASKEKPLCTCTDHRRQVRKAIREQRLTSIQSPGHLELEDAQRLRPAARRSIIT